MKIRSVALTKGAMWTIAQFGIGQAFRLSTNIILTRLLAPELFGIMTIVNTLKAGVELISDVGIGQSIIYNQDGDKPDFYDTAWTINLIRGFILWAVTCVGAIPAAYFYHTPSLLLIIPASSIVLVISGFTSVSQYLIQKKLQIAKLTVYEIIVGIIWATGQIGFAFFIPSVWALVLGMVFGSIVTMVGSYFLIPKLKHRLIISRTYSRQILHLGKWIFLSSAIYFLSMSFDRLYLASVIPLALLGVYGIARNISEIFTLLAMRLGSIVVFPFIALHSQMPRADLRAQLTSIRLKFLLLAALGFSISAATVDFAINIIFDSRYHAASWMVPILITGAWISVLCSLNESTLLGIGRPRFGAIGYGLKFCFLLVSLPLSFNSFGTLGGIVVIAVSDVFRYVSLVIGQLQERIAFFKQDLTTTILMLGFLLFFEWLRWYLGLGISLGNLPMAGR